MLEPQDDAVPAGPVPGDAECKSRLSSSKWLQVGLGFVLIELSLWWPSDHFRGVWMLAAAAFIVYFSIRSHYTTKQMGLSVPSRRVALPIVAAGFVLAVMIFSAAHYAGESQPRAWMLRYVALPYAIWSVIQEFILQSFFYIRLEDLAGSRIAVYIAALLFAMAHLPSPVLTIATLAGGIIFGELFRRFRNIYPVGIIHALLGLAIAASLPDSLLHHMRVGISYLRFHP
jgi:membrane protease YdiL (CAAX protease family)